jgi:hypothetical protein
LSSSPSQPAPHSTRGDETTYLAEVFKTLFNSTSCFHRS